ncbi:MAG: galactokinase [Armatimonadota bacterium]|nr:galactokinase [Armatimonadota bacterium]
MSFRDLFGSPPAAVACAPARVNLLGEHTDYNEGFVLPVPLPLATCVEAGVAEGLVEAYSVAFGERRARGVDAGPQGDWLDYPAGCVWALRREGFDVPGVRLRIDSTVPLGVGLSSSAALEVAVMRAVRQLYGLALDDLHLAQLAQRAEVEFVGVRCGIMDQMVASVGQAGTALLLDTRDLRYEHLPLLPGHRMVVIDSGVRRHLAEGKYNRRRVECERAARLLGVCALRDLTPDDLLRAETLPDPLPRRVRHVVCENARVWAGAQALRQADAITFGRLMSESHRSLRDDFEVSTPELDRLVEAALRARALGARLTGAGFGGAVVAVVPLEALDTFGSGLARATPSARILVR